MVSVFLEVVKSLVKMWRMHLWATPILQACCLYLVCGLFAAPSYAQIDFEAKPILYGNAPSQDPVSTLQNKLDTGKARLEFDEQQGYLRSLLRLLDIPISSQGLVYSKTSFQRRRIRPDRPRAVYFNDTTALGWVQDGDLIEIMTTDPVQGSTFYVLPQEKTVRPRFVRDRGQCLTCHASSQTKGIPGGMVRSVVVNAIGMPQLGTRTFLVDHRSPLEQRWGGWYVTGRHGSMRHMGNVISKDRLRPDRIDREAGANVVDLEDRLDLKPYLSPHSDIVALMVLEHQTQMQNLITLANYETRIALHESGSPDIDDDRQRELDHSKQQRVVEAGDRLLRFLLFADEYRLSDSIEGSSSFAREFAAKGPKDARGRSLREFDLKTRLFQYPCSYLIYSPSFDRLPKELHSYLATRLRDALIGSDEKKLCAHLSRAERQAIFEILRDTKPGFWRP